MDNLEIRVYNVRFGDAILISVPDDGVMRHILIDMGNAASKAGGENEVFKTAIQDIIRVLGGRPLDLYILTHEHLDHAQGLLWAHKKEYEAPTLKEILQVQHVWLPASADPTYYQTHPEAEKHFQAARNGYLNIEKFLKARPADEGQEKLLALLRNNNRFLQGADGGLGLSHGKTADCVDFIRDLVTDPANLHYVHRSIGVPRDGGPLWDTAGKHPFTQAEMEIWAPEEDTSVYYGYFRPMALDYCLNAPADGDLANPPKPPEGVDAGAFYNLVRSRQSGLIDNLLAIDKAANNTSIVFNLKWQDWNFLFAADAEIRSWKEMNKQNVLSPVDFIKVSHHASENGTPSKEYLDKLFPAPPAAGLERFAVVSTYPDTYSGIPDDETLAELENDYLCAIASTQEVPDGEPLIFEFEG